MGKYCLAYGRNLDLKRMQQKCPHCVLVGKAKLRGWRLAFKKYITIEPYSHGVVPVGVWEIDEEAEKELDIIEEYPTVYRKEIVSLIFQGKPITALVYVINDTHPTYPNEPYLQRILIGYKDFHFSKRYIYQAIKRLPQKRVYIFTDAHPKQYIKACKKLGMQTSFGLDTSALQTCDGLLIPGGGDINPALYHQNNTSSRNINTFCDEKTMQAIEFCLQQHKPILGICLGIEYINVYFGGTLKQDIANHKNVDHKIILQEKCLLQEYLGKACTVNSYHHQCIDKLAKNLIPLAHTADGVIEAVTTADKKIIGVQWHPEKLEHPTDIKIFHMFRSML